MELKHSVSFMIGNMGYLGKIFIWMLVCTLVVGGLAAAIYIPSGSALAKNEEILVEIEHINDVASKYLQDEISLYEGVAEIEQHIVKIVKVLLSNAGAMAGFIIAAICLYCLYLFLTGISHYTIGYITNELMTSNTKYGFVAAMLKNIKTACRFSACKMLISCPLDLSIIAVICATGFGLLKVIGFPALAIALILGVCLFSLRAMLYAGWIPRILFNPEEKMFAALSRSLSSVRQNFGGFFKTFATIFFTAYGCISVLTVPTFGVVNLLVPSTYFFVLRSVELIGYYKLNGMSFYVDPRTVVNTIEYGYRKENQTEAVDEFNDINY
ncbi:MAG: hypothetical protein J6S32_04240 [Clostridia bacterium]|nr:hypothetical protein [Clostridia bacterium]